jgi:hypothetical protein
MQCLVYHVGMTNVFTDQYDLWRQVRRALLSHAMYLRGEHIQNAQLVAMREQCIGQVRANKASSSCNQHTPVHRRLLYFSRMLCYMHCLNFNTYNTSGYSNFHTICLKQIVYAVT